jgi:hypothetical protein
MDDAPDGWLHVDATGVLTGPPPSAKQTDQAKESFCGSLASRPSPSVKDSLRQATRLGTWVVVAIVLCSVNHSLGTHSEFHAVGVECAGWKDSCYTVESKLQAARTLLVHVQLERTQTLAALAFANKAREGWSDSFYTVEAKLRAVRAEVVRVHLEHTRTLAALASAKMVANATRAANLRVANCIPSYETEAIDL